jgi:hypothetical protein
MATVLSRLNNRVDIILAMSPPISGAADTSPQLDTLQIFSEKTIHSESPAPTTKIHVGVDAQHECEFTDPEPEVQQHGDVVTLEPLTVAASADHGDTHDVVGVTPWNLCGETRSHIPAHLSESSPPERKNREEIGAEKFSVPSIGLDVEGSQASYADDTDRDGQESQATPAGHFERIPTSSIPQLLSTSKIYSAETKQSIQQQLGFVGDETSYTSIRSRQESFAFSLDGDDYVYKKVSNFPQKVIPIPHPNHWENIVMNVPHSTAQSFGNRSNMSSSTSLASVSPYQDVQYDTSSSYAQNNIASPPQNVSVTRNGEPPLDMHQLSLSISSIVIPNEAFSGQQNQGEQTKACSGAGATQRLLPPHQSHSRQSAVPELYSAINSLERYNPGSLDNKVLLAKARGGYGRQKAFPGVPINRTPSSSGNVNVEGFASSVNSRTESKGSSATSASGWKHSRSSGLIELDKTQHSGNSMMIEQIGSKKNVPLRHQPSESRIIKSRSSGNLTESGMKGTSDCAEGKMTTGTSNKGNRSVTINDQDSTSRSKRRREKKVGVFRPSSDAYTPRMGLRAIKYKPVEERASVEKISSTMGTIQRPNFRDALRRVAIILHQHIVKIELRFSTGIDHGVDGTGLFKASMRDEFDEENFATPRYKCSIVRVPMARPGVVYSMRKIRVIHTTPTADEIYEFAHQLFKKVSDHYFILHE